MRPELLLYTVFMSVVYLLLAIWLVRAIRNPRAAWDQRYGSHTKGGEPSDGALERIQRQSIIGLFVLPLLFVTGGFLFELKLRDGRQVPPAPDHQQASGAAAQALQEEEHLKGIVDAERRTTAPAAQARRAEASRTESAANANDPVADEMRKFAGTWQCISVVDNGTPWPAEEAARVTWVQDQLGNYQTFVDGHLAGSGVQNQVDPTAAPRIVVGIDNDQGKYVGIYRFVGDTVEMCTVPDGRPPPTEFASSAGSECILQVWKRTSDMAQLVPIGQRPTAERVARRAMVLSLVMYRASLEQFPGEARYEALHARLPEWIDRLGLADELEPEERDLLDAPLGQADDQAAANASWRNEGLAVLAWALQRFDLPPYDVQADPRKAADSVGFSEERLSALDTTAAQELLRTAELRPAAEIDHHAAHATIINWRLRSFRLGQISTGTELNGMDFRGYLKAHPSFQEDWLEGLRLVDNDLAIGPVAIGDADPADVETCEGTAVEREIAAYWLQGDAPMYSHVDAATVLSALSPEARSALYETHRSGAQAAYDRGKAHSENGELDQAIAEFTESIRLDANYTPAYFERAEAYSEKEQHAEAIADYNAAIQLDPGFALAFTGRGNAYAARKEFDKAIADYDAAIRIDSSGTPAYLMRAVTYGELGQFDRAFQDVDEAIRLAPDAPLGYQVRAKLWRDQGDNAKAEADERKAKELEGR